MKAAALAPARSLAFDLLELTKPRLTLFVLFVVAAGGALASAGSPDPLLLLHALLGTALVAGGGAALNMFLERDADALMRRTASRPLPSGRLAPREVLLFGVTLAVAGLALLIVATSLAAALAAAVTLATYLGVYTPLKRRTALNTLAGAVPGALPALIGWGAVTGRFEPSGWALFLVLYLWQIPHFLAIAWLYRDDYVRGGFRMLPGWDADGAAAGRQALLGAATLLPASLLPAALGLASRASLVGGLLLGGFFLLRAGAFARARTDATARRLLRGSLLYLPLYLATLFL
ncbi:MAG: heme o synthase [Planctomycetaceae bacterium]